MSDYVWTDKSIPEIARAMDDGIISSAELVRSCLSNIRHFDQEGPCLNSMICVNKQAEEISESLDEEFRTKGRRSLLHGIPIILKDNIDTKDMPTTAGSASLKENRPSQDAFIVKKLREAGAIILGKANLSEFARQGLTVGSLIGQTKNPYDLTRTPGGSSGGTAAAVAAGMAVAGIGSDSANSVRSPASACGLTGLRPTTGLLSRSGIIPCSFTQDSAGPITRNVTDAALLLDICQGFDRQDKKTSEQIGRTESSYTAFAQKNGLSGKKIGLLKTVYGQDKDVLRIMRETENVLQSMGAECIEIDVSQLDSNKVFTECDVQFYELKPTLEEYFTAASNCPVKTVSDLVQTGKIHETVENEFIRCAALTDPLKDYDYLLRLSRAAELRLLTLKVMAENRLDCFVYPHQQILPEPIVNRQQRGRNGIIASVIGFPAITVPGGFSQKSTDAPIGVPVGIEFMARPYSEGMLIHMAYSFEKAAGAGRMPVFRNNEYQPEG